MLHVSHSVVIFLIWCMSAAGTVGILFYQIHIRARRQKRLSETTAARYSMPGKQGLLLTRSINVPWKVRRGMQSQVGFRKRNLNWIFPYLRVLAAVIGALAFASITFLFWDLNFLTDWMGVAGLTLSAVLASLIPGKFLAYRVKRRRQQLEAGMPDLIDLLVLCVDAGQTLDAALARAVRQMRQINPVLCEEMQLTLHELNILPDRAQAFTNLQKRAGSDLVNFFVLAVNQTAQYGTPLSATLKALAEENRRSVMIDLENRANRLPVLLSLPLILFILPPAIGLSVGPGFILMLRGLGG